MDVMLTVGPHSLAAVPFEFRSGGKVLDGPGAFTRPLPVASEASELGQWLDKQDIGIGWMPHAAGMLNYFYRMEGAFGVSFGLPPARIMCVESYFTGKGYKSDSSLAGVDMTDPYEVAIGYIIAVQKSMEPRR